MCDQATEAGGLVPPNPSPSWRRCDVYSWLSSHGSGTLKNGRTDVHDEARAGRPSASDETIAKVEAAMRRSTDYSSGTVRKDSGGQQNHN
ncbi:hypothetical protein TNCV_4562181 [Trichonephila clavipes]|nr:hypothetical protein TNCV_4562181 [Trichonephila clavipes]